MKIVWKMTNIIINRAFDVYFHCMEKNPYIKIFENSMYGIMELFSHIFELLENVWKMYWQCMENVQFQIQCMEKIP